MTQQQPYTILRSYDSFEVRQYPDYLLVQAEVDGDFDTAGNRAFRPLFGYITGANSGSTKFEMTAPVIQEQHGESRYVVSFVLPEGVDAASVPLPRDAQVSTRLVPGHDVAAKRFRGGWSEQSFRRQGAELLEHVATAGLETVDEVYFARFDPPWMPGLLKHNEALVAIRS